MAITNPAKCDSDFAAMDRAWRKVDDLLAGTEAVRLGGEKYLPRLPRESRTDYAARVATAPYANIFRDITDNLAARPFAKKAHVVDGSASKRILDLAEDIDGEGSNLHIFGQNVFRAGINYGVAYLFVDHTKVPEGATVADMKRLGARPYMVDINPRNMLSARTAFIGGSEQFVHVRWRRTVVEQDGYDEVTREQVFECDRPKQEDGSYGKPVYKLHQKKPGHQTEWELIETGSLDLDVIPLVAFVPGRRFGKSWKVTLPMGDAADLQIEHYQAESGLKQLKTLCQYPMIAAEGVDPPEAPKNGQPATIDVGPQAFLFAPMNDGKAGSYKILEPTGASVKVLADDIERIEKTLREIGRQPLTANSGNLTVVTTQFAASKGNSAVEAWALILKDAFERAFGFMAIWLQDASKPEVQFHLDLPTDMTGADFSSVEAMRKNGDISRETYWIEAKRRGILSADHSAEDEKDRLAAESPDPDTEDDLEAATTPRRVLPFNR